ncbi:MAG TPA: phosphate regulon sensor histidine kinase PhoR [Gammaproteobacteria bacterium]|nr:phosphate regulon sensor histidine kinase PhoR [Gammaproteobacteria bacterium]
MNDAWKAEVRRVLVLAALALLAGFISGRYLPVLLLVTAGYLAWHLYNVRRLLVWLRAGKGFEPPESSGVWDAIYEDIYRLQQRNRNRKRNLRRLLKRFHKMTAALPDGTVELRSGGEEIEWWNNAASRLLGLSYPRDVGQRISTLIRHPAFQHYLAGGDFDKAVEMPSPVDENITLRLRMIPYSGNRRLLIARDMTRLQSLERTRQDFVANASHELRSPLTVLAGYLETLAGADGSCRDYQPQLRIMQAQTERMNRIVEDLMLLSQLESETPGVDAAPVPVPQLVDTLVEQARELDGVDGHEFVVEVDRGLCLRGRESEIYSAFSNLVFNALRYTPAGGRITLRWRREEAAPVFSVEDTGTGIAPHHLPRLTERFYRVDAGRSREHGGTGLGLAIVKHVLMRHDGRLLIDSEPERGSTFSCRFDADRAVDCPPA